MWIPDEGIVRLHNLILMAIHKLTKKALQIEIKGRTKSSIVNLKKQVLQFFFPAEPG